MNIAMTVIAIVVIAGFVYWRLKVRKPKRRGSTGTGTGGGGGGPSKS